MYGASFTRLNHITKELLLRRAPNWLAGATTRNPGQFNVSFAKNTRQTLLQKMYGAR